MHVTQRFGGCIFVLRNIRTVKSNQLMHHLGINGYLWSICDQVLRLLTQEIPNILQADTCMV